MKPITITETTPMKPSMIAKRQPHHKLGLPTATLVADKASKRGDDFYDAEQHTYSVVNVKHKKRAKKTPEDGEGERGEPPVDNLAMTGDVSQGVGEEGYSKLKH